MNEKYFDENMNEYRIGKKIGAGGQGAVYFVQNNEKIVIKALVDNDNSIIKDGIKYDQFKKKINNVMALPSVRNLASPLVMLKRPYCGYVMRFMEKMIPLEKLMIPDKKGIVDSLINRANLLKRYYILRNIAKILKDLSEMGLVYCDISPKNIFVSSDINSSEVWLIDVDNLHFQTDYNTCIGTPMYRAPEIFQQLSNTIQSDLYSFALVAFEFLTFQKPFDGSLFLDENNNWDSDNYDENKSLDKKIENGDIPWIYQQDNQENKSTNTGINIDLVCTEKIRRLFEQTLNRGRNNPLMRPSINLWYQALVEACNQLTRCSNHHHHFGVKCFLCNERHDILVATAYQRFAHIFENEQGEEVVIYNDIADHKAHFEVDSKRLSLPNSLFYTLILDDFFSVMDLSFREYKINQYDIKVEVTQKGKPLTKENKSFENIRIDIDSKKSISRYIIITKEKGKTNEI